MDSDSRFCAEKLNGNSVDPIFRAKVLEYMGRDPHPTGAGRAIYHITAPMAAEFRFEWHPQKRIVYLIRIGAVPEVGQAIAHCIETHGDALNAVLIWMRGFREGETHRLRSAELKV